MQQKMKSQKKHQLKQQGMMSVIGFFWVLGLLAAGSEGSGMPWMNAVGLIVFLFSSVILGRCLHQADKHRPASQKLSDISRNNSEHRRTAKVKTNSRVHIRFA